MRYLKIFSALILLQFFSNFAFSQIKIGINVSPSLLFSRVSLEDEKPGYDIEPNGMGIGFIGGPEVSMFFGSSENYSITLGAWYALKRAKYKFDKPETPSEVESRNTSLQYIQLPLTFKLYTNEIATDLKLYFQLGASADILVGGREIGSKLKSTEGYKFFDSSIIMGAGVKYSLGENTALLLGLRYSRGLINSLTKDNIASSKDFKVANDMFSLDLGIQF
jgi:hypothetical protein